MLVAVGEGEIAGAQRIADGQRQLPDLGTEAPGPAELDDSRAAGAGFATDAANLQPVQLSLVFVLFPLVAQITAVIAGERPMGTASPSSGGSSTTRTRCGSSRQAGLAPGPSAG